MKEYIKEIQRDIVYLMKNDGYSIDDIASLFSVDNETIKNILKTIQIQYLSRFIKRPKVPTSKIKRKGIVYFLQQDTNDGCIKIGFTQGQLKNRITSLQTGCSFRLKLLKSVNADNLLECKLHEKFHADRLSGEWFKPSKELLEFIQKLG